MTGPKVVMVCFANICRSPYAEIAARSLAEGGLDVSSAGIQGFTAQPMDAEMAAQLAMRGLSAEGFRSRRLDAATVAAADLILTMESAQRSYILDEWPAALRRVFTLRQFANSLAAVNPAASGTELITEAFRRRGPNDPALDVPDPYRRGSQAAAATADLLDAQLALIVPRLTDRGPA